MPICPGHASAVVIYCHFSNFSRLNAPAAVSSGHCGRVPTGLKQMTGNYRQAQSQPTAHTVPLRSTPGAPFETSYSLFSFFIVAICIDLRENSDTQLLCCVSLTIEKED